MSIRAVGAFFDYEVFAIESGESNERITLRQENIM
jgi:hypothetical protein